VAWIESHQELGAHPKTRKLARVLGITRPTAVGHLQFLWWWAMDYAEDGELARFEAIDVAIGGEWEGEPETFVDALVDAGFLLRHDNTLSINDWHDYAGKLIERRKADAERKRAGRRRDETSVRTLVAVASTGCPVDGVRTAYVPNPTVPNPTVPNHAPQPPAAPIPSSRPTPVGVAAPVLTEAIGDRWSKISADFAAIDPELSATWLRQSLAEAELECDGGAAELDAGDVRAALTVAYKAVARALNDDDAKSRIKIPRAYARSQVVEAICERLNDVREHRRRPSAPPEPARPITSKPPPPAFSRTAAAIERERHEQPITERNFERDVGVNRRRPDDRTADGRRDRDTGPRPPAGVGLVPGRTAAVRGPAAEHRPRTPYGDPVHDARHRRLPDRHGPLGRLGRPRA